MRNVSYIISTFSYYSIWLKNYQNGNQIEPSEQRLQEIGIAKKSLHASFESAKAFCKETPKTTDSNLA